MIGRLVIRADADGAMGTGHIMRCLALAEAWRDRGGEVMFAGRIEPEALRTRIKAEGADLVELADRYPAPADLTVMCRLAGEQLRRNASLGWLVLDGYHFDDGYQQAVRAAGWQLLVIDDLGRLPQYHCEALLNQNLYAPTLAYRCPPETVMLLGPRYALLRREFLELGKQERPLPEVAQRVLVTMGGADEHNVTARILSALAVSGSENMAVKAVVGAANPHFAELAALAAGLPFQCELLCDVADMASLMRWADAAVSAAGTTVWELACAGTPYVTLITADNQEANAGELARQGIAMTLGWHDALGQNALAARLREFLHDGARRRSQAARGRDLVDGRGADRVVTALLAREMRLRPASEEDSARLLQWANDPETRKNSFSSGVIGQKEHEQWLAGKLADPACRLWIAALSNTVPVAMVRFELHEGRPEISVNLAPEQRGQGLGSVVVGAACARLFQEEPGVARIIAQVKASNHASLAAFARAGFILEGETERLGIPTVSLRLERNRHE